MGSIPATLSSGDDGVRIHQVSASKAVLLASKADKARLEQLLYSALEARLRVSILNVTNVALECLCCHWDDKLCFFRFVHSKHSFALMKSQARFWSSNNLNLHCQQYVYERSFQNYCLVSDAGDTRVWDGSEVQAFGICGTNFLALNFGFALSDLSNCRCRGECQIRLHTCRTGLPKFCPIAQVLETGNLLGHTACRK